MANTIKHEFDDLYRGVDRDFDEKQYLTELSKVRYEIKRILKKYNTLLSNDGFGTDDRCFAHSDKRIDKNGAMVIEFSAGIPYNIVTPYGSFPVRSPLRNDDFKQDERCVQELVNLFGLTPVAGNADMMAITKLPWQEKMKARTEQKLELNDKTEVSQVKPIKQSFFSRIFSKKRQATVDESKEPKHTATITKSNIISKLLTKLNLRAPVNFYSLKVYGDMKDDIATMIFHEEKHINQLLAEIDTQFIQNGHPEYMLPGDKTKYSVDGKEYVVNKIYRSYTPHSREDEKNESTEKQVTNVQPDLGREM